MFVGLGAARVRELFQQAKEKAPALVFLDEIDTIGKGRSGAMGAGFGAHDEREQTLNQLLVEMDGFDASKGVIIMAATNRPDVLDPALVRPGRFDRQVVVDRPDLRGREEILRVHARGVALETGVDLRRRSRRARRGSPAPTSRTSSTRRRCSPPAATRTRSPSWSSTRRSTARRSASSASRASCPRARRSARPSTRWATRWSRSSTGDIDPLHRVTIVPRGTAALGVTWVRPTEDRFMRTEPELKVLDGLRDGRARRRGALLRRRRVDRRAQRSREGDRDRARDGHRYSA